MVQRCVENVPPDFRWLNKNSTYKANRFMFFSASSLTSQTSRNSAIGQVLAISMSNLATITAKLTHDQNLLLHGDHALCRLFWACARPQPQHFRHRLRQTVVCSSLPCTIQESSTKSSMFTKIFYSYNYSSFEPESALSRTWPSESVILLSQECIKWKGTLSENWTISQDLIVTLDDMILYWLSLSEPK